ncbi:MAG: hypothetical protein RSC07_03415 [Mucinivorans sp.]
MKKVLFCLFALLPLAAAAQNNCIAFSPVIGEQMDELSKKSLETLRLKTEQIITRSNAAKTSLYSAFVIYPELNILENETVQAGVNNITVISAELTLFAANSIDQSRYGSTTITIEGSGTSKNQAISNMMQSIKPTNPIFVKFIKNATQEIADYYTDNMPVVIRKAETLVAGEKYDDALLFLSSIPVCVPAYEQSSEAIKSLYNMVSKKSCHTMLTQAEKAFELGDMDKAREMVMNIKPGSECDAAAKILAEKIGTKSNSTPLIPLTPAKQKESK